MDANLAVLVTRFVTPDTVERIAVALGLERSKTQAAVDAAIPALLAAFRRVAADAEGAETITDAVQQQPGAAERFAGRVSEGGRADLIDRGSRVVGSILPDTDQAAITAAVARFSSTTPSAARSLLSMLAPVALSVIGSELERRGTDASGVAGLLAEQKAAIDAAMPPGLADMISGNKIIEATKSGVPTMTATAAHEAARAVLQERARQYSAGSYAGRSRHDAARNAARAAWSGFNPPSFARPDWVYWAVPMAVIVALGGYVLSTLAPATRQFASTAPGALQTTVSGKPQTAPPAATLDIAAIDMSRQLDRSLTMLRSSLEGISSAETANAALPRLQALSTQVDRLGGAIGQLTPEQRKLFVGVDATAMNSLDRLMDRVVAMPGVSEVLKPTIDGLKKKLATLPA
jgi:hypothetical protein